MRRDAVAVIATAFVAGIPYRNKVCPRLTRGEDGAWISVREGVLECDFASGGVCDAHTWDKRGSDTTCDGVNDPRFALCDLELVGIDVVDTVDRAGDSDVRFQLTGRFAGVVGLGFGDFGVGLDDDHDGVGDTELRGDAEGKAADLGVFGNVQLYDRGAGLVTGRVAFGGDRDYGDSQCI